MKWCVNQWYRPRFIFWKKLNKCLEKHNRSFNTGHKGSLNGLKCMISTWLSTTIIKTPNEGISLEFSHISIGHWMAVAVSPPLQIMTETATNIGCIVMNVCTQWINPIISFYHQFLQLFGLWSTSAVLSLRLIGKCNHGNVLDGVTKMEMGKY